jgi:hypothetical protein
MPKVEKVAKPAPASAPARIATAEPATEAAAGPERVAEVEREVRKGYDIDLPGEGPLFSF